MKKKASIILSVLMVFTMLCAAQLPAAALPAGTTIYINTYEAGWDNAYIYGWDCGLQGEFIQMEETPHRGIYSFTLPQQSPDGLIYFYFCDRNSWDRQERTESLSTQSGKNFYTIYEKDSYGKWSGRWSYVAPVEPTEPPTQPPTEPPIETPTVPTEAPTVEPTEPPTERPTEAPYVSATPSTDFYFKMDVDFRTNCARAAYTINDEEPVTFTNYETLNIGGNIPVGSAVTIQLAGYDTNGNEICSASYQYTKCALSRPAPTEGIPIYFDNTETQWEHVYFYGYNWTFYYHQRYENFIEMTLSEIPGIYMCIIPQNMYDSYKNSCFITNQTTWGEQQETKLISLEQMFKNGDNTIIPCLPSTGGVWNFVPTHYSGSPNSIPYLSATNSKEFSEELEIALFKNCDYATYTFDGAFETEFKNGDKITITESTAIEIKGYNILGELVMTEYYHYSKLGYTTISASVFGYTGDIYAYLFDGDRRDGTFYLMVRNADGTYSYTFDGKAKVIFTTTNDWATAIELNEEKPLIPVGATLHFELFYPYP